MITSTGIHSTWIRTQAVKMSVEKVLRRRKRKGFSCFIAKFLRDNKVAGILSMLWALLFVCSTAIHVPLPPGKHNHKKYHSRNGMTVQESSREINHNVHHRILWFRLVVCRVRDGLTAHKTQITNFLQFPGCSENQVLQGLLAATGRKATFCFSQTF